MTDIKYVELQEESRRLDAGPKDKSVYRHLLVSVMRACGLCFRFLVDEKGIRVLGSPVRKAVLPKDRVQKIIVWVHTDAAFSVLICFKKNLLVRCFNFVLPTEDQYEDIGTSFGGLRPEEVEECFRKLGYDVERKEK